MTVALMIITLILGRLAVFLIAEYIQFMQIMNIESK
jgi:hypothetical protein